MKKGIIILVVVVVVLVMAWMGIYNNLITSNEKINQTQSEIDNQLKRRVDLVPNLVNTVKGLTAQEQKLVDTVTSARTKMASGTIQEKLDASDELTSSLNIFVENYPIVKSDTAFVSLMDELSGTENRIAVARKSYNDTIGSYNILVKTFPTSIVASISGFSTKTYLETTTADKINPEVQF